MKASQVHEEILFNDIERITEQCGKIYIQKIAEYILERDKGVANEAYQRGLKDGKEKCSHLKNQK